MVFMEDKKENKTFIMVLIGIIGVCLITIGLTYAYWILTREQSGENVVNTACLNINFTGENDIGLDKAYPMNNEQLEKFLSTATPYHFTIHNECSDKASASINLESLTVDGKALDDQWIDAILYEDTYSTNLNSEKKLNESMYNDENKVISNSLHAYELYNFVLQKGETKSFNLLLYMDPNTPMETANMNASWKGKITLSAGYKEEKFANLANTKVVVVESGDGLYEVKHDDLDELGQEWNKTEYRYAGINPNNYVSFNNEIWRIIGLVNAKNGESIEQRVKIVRTDGVKEQKDFGTYSWDSKRQTGSSDSYFGSNDWTDSQLKYMLNSVYYKSEKGECYKGSTASQCDFTGSGTEISGLDNIVQEMIDKDIIWNIGGTDVNTDDGLVNLLYEYERGKKVYTGISRETEWSIKNDNENYNGIGLIYPSDYGYATNGGNLGRNNCIKIKLYEWNNDKYNIECGGTDWLKPSSNYIWTITPYSTYSDFSLSVSSNGNVTGLSTNGLYSVWPALYLKSSVKITPNPRPEQEYGTVDNPFQLSMSE